MINIALHGHFYQPPREDPATGKVPADESAAPSHDWNERVASECYIPNGSARILAPDGRIIAEKNNYERLSFDFGPTLHKWIEGHHPVLDESIRKNGARAVAQAYSHMILPLACGRDRLTQVLWGIRDFEYRFGRRPKGMWLPECAVNTDTLETMASCGVEFTILSPLQCASVITEEGAKDTDGGAGLDVTRPYRCELPSGRSVTVFFYHTGIAQGIAFGGMLDNGDRFAEALLREAQDNDGRILLTATDGESYGHHHKFGEMALARCFMTLEKDRRVSLPSLEEFLEKHPPTARCVIKENSSWSCAHGVERWRSDCGCHTGGEEGWNQKWRAPLRAAFDSLAENLDALFEERLTAYCDPWQLRNEAIEIYKNGTPRPHDEIEAEKRAFLAERMEGKDDSVYSTAAALLEMQRMRMFMYTSCAWFFNDISGVETKHAIACAVRAAQIAEEITGRDMTSSLLSDLKEVRGNSGACPDAAAAAMSFIVHQEAETECENNVFEQNKDESGKDKMMNSKSNLANTLLSTLEKDPAFRNVAYFSMEIALKPEIPTYSGGLGVLAGDILKSAADLGVPMVGVTLLYRRGYFAQKINKDGRQTEAPVSWNPRDQLTQLPNRVSLFMNGRNVTIGVWSYTYIGSDGHTLPIYFIDTDLPENCEEDRDITAELYGGDNRCRLCQELILGIGGLRLLRDMGYRNITTFHLNEGHAGFLTLELLREQGYSDIDKIRNQVIFTTHTPVAAGHDFFSYDLINEVMDSYVAKTLQKHVGGSGLSMTDLALKFSHYVNGVSHKHALVSREMFHDDTIDWITNGVHSATWTCPSFAKLYDAHIPGWSNDPSRLMQALRLPDDELWNAHQAAKMRLLAFVLEETGRQLNPDLLTIGFARRAATYKRADLVFSDLKRLISIAKGRVQFIFSGKAHPHDEPGKDIIQRINMISKELGEELPVVFIENYNMGPAKYIVSGVDLWLNTPIRPREASGTSGMKCVHNGVMNFSVLDGWWIEGCIEGLTGWGIGAAPESNELVDYKDSDDADDLYDKLERLIIPLYYNDRRRWINMMKAAIAINASYFNTHRVVREYCEKAYGTMFRGH